MELAKQLRVHLDTASSAESMDLLVQKILSSYEKALLILQFSRPMSMGQPQQNVGATSGVPESPLSINGSPRSDDLDKDNQDTRDVSKKRKMLPRWTDHVRVTSENLLEGTHDDGYSWRKYGQKDILGAKYPRSYYRCTYRHTQDCWATKQVQKSDEDPTIFEITYRGTHTCVHGNQPVPPPASPEKQEYKLTNLNTNNNQQLQSQASQPQMNSFGGMLSTQNSEPDLKELISANTSATNSPIIDLDFSLDQLELDPNFQFDAQGFFSS
ncbi:hypothetical protein V6Z12_D12G269100 [Gossypium hirsutum]